MSTEVAQTQPRTLVQYLDEQITKRADKFATLLQGTGVSPDKFKLVALQQLASKAELAKAAQNDPASFISSMLTAAEQGLDFARPNEAHLVPIGGKVVLFRGYKGIVKMARRNERVADIDVQVVRANDKYERRYGTAPFMSHEPPALGEDRGHIIGFYAIAYLKFENHAIWEEMSAEAVERHAKRFVKAANGPFAEIKKVGQKAENFEAYGLKTVLIRLCNRKLDLSAEMGMALNDEFEAEGAPVNDSDDSIPLTPEPEDLNAKLAAKRAAKTQSTAVIDAEIVEPEDMDHSEEQNELTEEELAQAERELAR